MARAPDDSEASAWNMAGEEGSLFQRNNTVVGTPQDEGGGLYVPEVAAHAAGADHKQTFASRAGAQTDLDKGRVEAELAQARVREHF